ncbi:MAG: thiamine-phosphate kinase [Rickettsiales bacterium]|nr:thiamine-phosphate kinase [Rickettsiales bacterium]
MDEFALIKTYFSPLGVAYSGSLNLSDDAAVITPPPGCDLVVTKDAISEGVHFIGNEDPALIAKKLLRVNLSDLAAMGATPVAYFLAVILPRNTSVIFVERFAEGLNEDQTSYGIALAGGDTISTHGTLSFSLTALGSVATGRALKRSGARAGDLVYVSGTLGDSAIGLKLLQANLDANLLPQATDYLSKRYYLPEPRLALGQKLVGIASSCMDISDGLLQDLGHICTASQCGARIERAKLPLSTIVRSLVSSDEKLWDDVVAGGDDYELLFTVPADRQWQVEALSNELGLTLSHIGSITEGSDSAFLDEQGNVLPKPKGFKHF